MAYEQLAFPKYNRLKKRLPDALKGELNYQEDRIAEDPRIGKEKRGDLKGVFVHKFKVADQEYLLAYFSDRKKKLVTFLAVGGHENFYRNLKKYLKKR